MSSIIVFDVDGVIVDSTQECLVIAWNAYQEYTHNNQFISSPKEADRSFADTFIPIRKYVKSMDEYLVVFSKNVLINNQKQYDNSISSLDDGELKAFGKCFFNQRKLFKSNNLQNWISLHIIHDDVITAFKQKLKTHNVYIVTGKDKSSVLDILHHYSISFDPLKIYDRYAAKNKFLCLKKILEIENAKSSEITFIDDNVMHLLEPHNANYNCFLADWGYVTDEHLAIAKKNDINTIKMDQLFKLT